MVDRAEKRVEIKRTIDNVRRTLQAIERSSGSAKWREGMLRHYREVLADLELQLSNLDNEEQP